MTSVPTPVLGPEGFIAPAAADIQAGVFADYNAAFGGDMNPDDTTPQGQLITATTAVIDNSNDLFLQYVAGVDPAFSSGRMQDGIGRIYFLDRTAAEPTVALCVCGGAANVPIPTGALAKSSDGNIYICTGGGIIPIGGSISLEFACTVTGPTPCPAGSVNEIYQSVPGWDTISNPSDGVTGNDVESPAAFEARRSASVALNALGTVPALRASILGVINVLDAYVTENPTATTATIGGISIAAHSMYAAVSGGASVDVAAAIFRKKPPGCGMVGNTTITVADTNSGYSLPYPTYSVTFQIPTPTAIKFAISLTNTTAVPSDAVAQIKAALVAAFNGLDGGARAKIGATIYASRFYAPVIALGTWAKIISLKVGTSTANLDDILLNIDLVPTIDPSNIAVTLV